MPAPKSLEREKFAAECEKYKVLPSNAVFNLSSISDLLQAVGSIRNVYVEG